VAWRGLVSHCARRDSNPQIRLGMVASKATVFTSFTTRATSRTPVSKAGGEKKGVPLGPGLESRTLRGY
jgi:hypothetical protein